MPMHSDRSQYQAVCVLLRRRGQSLIEFALASAFLMLLLAAAVDAGLAYRSYQTLINASANASSYLAQFPLDDGSDVDSLNSIPEANTKALNAFRNEQGGSRLSVGGNTLDLNANESPDSSEFGASYSSTWSPWFSIMEADSTDVINNYTVGYGVNSGFTGTSNSRCQDREQFDSSSTSNKQPCFIVVRAQVIYRPFFLSPVFGQQLTIRAVSVKPIVGYPVR